jgi:hypothetical protein
VEDVILGAVEDNSVVTMPTVINGPPPLIAVTMVRRDIHLGITARAEGMRNGEVIANR